jgi:hypothetical protein
VLTVLQELVLSDLKFLGSYGLSLVPIDGPSVTVRSYIFGLDFFDIGSHHGKDSLDFVLVEGIFDHIGHILKNCGPRAV